MREIQKNTPAFKSVFHKIIGLEPVTLSKAEPHVFACEFCKILRTAFIKAFMTTASETKYFNRKTQEMLSCNYSV